MSQPLYIRDLKQGQTYVDIQSGENVRVDHVECCGWYFASGTRFNKTSGDKTHIDILDMMLMEEPPPPVSKPVKLTNAPMYANLYPTMVQIARDHGYALAIHGSMVRDMDVIAVPWVEAPSQPELMVAAFCKAIAFDQMDGPKKKLHGRLVWTLAFPGECFVDLSVMAVGEER